MTRYGIWCQVWGGRTGFRESWLKSKSGEPTAFGDLDAAQDYAATLTLERNTPRATAQFKYEAKELTR